MAVDPIRLEEVLEVLEGRAAPLRVGLVESAIPLEDLEIEAHLARVTMLLHQFTASQVQTSARSVRKDIPGRLHSFQMAALCWPAVTGRRRWRLQWPRTRPLPP